MDGQILHVHLFAVFLFRVFSGNHVFPLGNCSSSPELSLNLVTIALWRMVSG